MPVPGPVVATWLHGYRLPVTTYVYSITLIFGVAGAAQLAMLEELPLDPETQAAVLHAAGALGEPLRATVAYERGEWDSVGCLGLP